MRTVQRPRVLASASLASIGVLLMAGCATTARPQPYRTFFVPPAPAAVDAEAPLPDPPGFELYASEVPSLKVTSLPPLTRPSETDFILRQSENYFVNGKRAFQDGRIEDARRDFDRSVQSLLAAPENLPDRDRVEARLEKLVDEIYKYDLDQHSGADSDSDGEIAHETRPLDEILELTFPVDPNIRSKVRKEVQVTGSELPLEESDAVLSFINYFTNGRGKKTIEFGLKRQGRYKAMIERILAEEGVPKELMFLAQAESGFFPRAASPARGCGTDRCMGMWQFAGFRGREYGLKQTSSSDDRMDPELATRAAARHLRDLYIHFGDWYLAMAAYNCGPGCVDSAVARTGYADFWALSRVGALPRETANYVPAILAMTIVSRNAADYGVEVDYDPALDYDSIDLESPTHVALIAAAVDMPVSELRELNPALTRSVAPQGYSLHVPKGSLPQVEAAFQAVPATQRDHWRIHKVEYGDTVASLAKRYGANPTAIASSNNGDLPEPGSLAAIPVAYPGDPVKKTVAARPVKRTAQRTAPPARTAAHPAPAKTKAAAKPAKPAKQTPPVARRNTKRTRPPA